jgi:alanine racemase
MQSRRFRDVVAQAMAGGFSIPLIHANSSGGLLHQPETMFNLVRPGLLVYGIIPRGKRRLAVRFHEHLRPALAFKCRVSFVKEIAKGTSLSYGRTFIAPRKMRVATLTAGYGDGYMRAGSNRAEVLVRGRRCRVLGRITMDQMLVDVSRVSLARSGDEAVLIGRQGRDAITAEEVAGWCGTIPWEVLTAITYRVPRLYRGGHAA